MQRQNLNMLHPRDHIGTRLASRASYEQVVLPASASVSGGMAVIDENLWLMSLIHLRAMTSTARYPPRKQRS